MKSFNRSKASGSIKDGTYGTFSAFTYESKTILMNSILDDRHQSFRNKLRIIKRPIEHVQESTLKNLWIFLQKVKYLKSNQ